MTPQLSEFTSAVNNCWGFCRGKTSILMVMTSAKILLMWLFCSKIYIQFTFFNTYFSTKLLFTNKRYHYACAREVSVYAIRSQINYIFSAVYSYFFSSFMWQWNKLWFQVLYHRISKILQCHIFKQLFFLFHSFTIIGPFSCDVHDIQKDIFEGKPPQN